MFDLDFHDERLQRSDPIEFKTVEELESILENVLKESLFFIPTLVEDGDYDYRVETFLEEYNNRTQKELYLKHTKADLQNEILQKEINSIADLGQEVTDVIEDLATHFYQRGYDCFDIEGNLDLNYLYDPDTYYGGKKLNNIFYTYGSISFIYSCFLKGFTDAKFYHFLNTFKEKKTTTSLTGFDVCKSYSDNQLEKLHDKLVDAHFIRKNKQAFINAFNGSKIIEKIEWIDESRNHHINSQTIYQLLHSLNILNLESQPLKISKENKELMKSIFLNDLGNITSKVKEFWNENTERQKEIASIVASINQS